VGDGWVDAGRTVTELIEALAEHLSLPVVDGRDVGDVLAPFCAVAMMGTPRTMTGLGSNSYVSIGVQITSVGVTDAQARLLADKVTRWACGQIRGTWIVDIPLTTGLVTHRDHYDSTPAGEEKLPQRHDRYLFTVQPN
jgi:hypothetical protein